MKKWTGFLFFTLLLHSPILSFAEELGGGYSLNPPAGWVVSEFPGSPYKGLFGTPMGNFTPNINLQEDNYSGEMDTYVQLSYVQLQKLMKAERVSQSSFANNNHSGVKLVTNTQYNDMKLTQTFYFFETPSGKKVVVTATTDRNSGSEFEAVFDDILATFQMK